MRRREVYIFAGMIGLLPVFFCLSVLLGSESLGWKQVLNSLIHSNNVPDYLSGIVMEYRLPKAIVALLSGILLSAAGLQMQTIFRNPLADPYIMGISSGAGLGVALFTLGVPVGWLGAVEWIKPLGNMFAACIGAAGIMFLIILVANRIRDILAVLILGVMFGSAISSIISLLQYFSQAAQLKNYVIWTMGSLGNLTSDELKLLLIPAVVGIFLSLYSIKWLNVLQLGEDYAQSMGVSILVARNIILIATCIMAGSIAAFCGPISFIGIAVPHMARMLFKTSNHAILMPGSMILGGIVMMICNIVSQLPGETSIPINTITALIGVPIILWVIVKNQKWI